MMFFWKPFVVSLLLLHVSRPVFLFLFRASMILSVSEGSGKSGQLPEAQRWGKAWGRGDAQREKAEPARWCTVSSLWFRVGWWGCWAGPQTWGGVLSPSCIPFPTWTRRSCVYTVLRLLRPFSMPQPLPKQFFHTTDFTLVKTLGQGTLAGCLAQSFCSNKEGARLLRIKGFCY